MSDENKNISNVFQNDEIIDKHNKRKRKKRKDCFSSGETILIVVITSVVSILMGLFVSSKLGVNSLSDDMKNFIKELNSVKNSYYESIEEKELLDVALKSVINSLGDPYSGVLSDSLSNSINTELNGSYSGLGVEVTATEDKFIKIVNVIANSPAEKAKLQSGDVIIKLNGESIEGLGTTEFSTKVKSAEDQTLKLTIKRNNEEIEFSVKREVIELQSITTDIIEKNNKKVGYIYISIFAANTHKQFSTALKDLENKKIDSLIIDVRDNSGGHLTAVENIMSLFLDSSKIIYQTDDKGKIVKYYSKGSKNIKYPLAVLINGVSASASEMLAATLDEQCNAILVGETTFGKGTVQELKDTSSNVQYKITTKKWLTPNGNWIHEKGVNPDFEVSLDDKYYDNPSVETDNQLQKAIYELTK